VYLVGRHQRRTSARFELRSEDRPSEFAVLLNAMRLSSCFDFLDRSVLSMPLSCEKGVSDGSSKSACVANLSATPEGRNGNVLPCPLSTQYQKELNTVLSGSESTWELSKMRKLEET